MDKLDKAQAGYLCRPGFQYVCGECVFQKKLPGGRAGCALFGRKETISLVKGSCNYFTPGPQLGPAIPWISKWTKEELGYVENERGFSCKRCEEFAVGKNDCRKVNKDSDGDTPGIISPDGCCSNWEADAVRAAASPAQLVQILLNPIPTRPERGALDKLFTRVMPE